MYVLTTAWKHLVEAFSGSVEAFNSSVEEIWMVSAGSALVGRYTSMAALWPLADKHGGAGACGAATAGVPSDSHHSRHPRHDRGQLARDPQVWRVGGEQRAPLLPLH